MAQATFSIRMDEKLKHDFDILCTDFGMNASTAFNIFARAVVREKRIPFEIQASSTASNQVRGLNAFMALRQEAQKNGIQNLSLEEINKEINNVRYGGGK
ncbi:MAG: type II toxin-antitoxin system RelB/DinJ family antitoxin [Candidatus Gastranaerophilaceae bacterium]